MESLDAIFQASYAAIADRADETWEPVPVTGWIWNKRMDDVMFVQQAPQYPNGAIEIVPPRRVITNFEEDYSKGEFLVRKVFPTRQDAIWALMDRLDRRIARATSMKKRLAGKLEVLKAGAQ